MSRIIYGTLYMSRLVASGRGTIVVRKYKHVYSEQEAKLLFELYEEQGWQVTFSLATTDKWGD